MGNITINKSVLEKYFGLLEKFDNSSKKRLILKLTESLDSQEKNTDLKSLYGAWEDLRQPDKIIEDIKNSRVNHIKRGYFE